MPEELPLSINNAAEIMLKFLRAGAFTDTISQLEHGLEGRTGEESRDAAMDAGIDTELFTATMVLRAEFGRISDLIHACAIVLALPHLLEPAEIVEGRPSLAAGNDPTRPFDLETDRRITEFKLSRWTAGSNATRKRQTFKDLMGLAMDESGRRAELYVVGPQPAQFLRTSRSTPAWALNRSPETLQKKFTARYGSLDMPISQFTATDARHVEIIDLASVLPQLFSVFEAIPVPTDEDEATP